MKTTIFTSLLIFTWLCTFSQVQIQWQKCYGGSSADLASYIDQTADGGYILAGSAKSNDGDVLGHHAYYDMWIVKLDSIGNIIWQKCYGGSKDDYASCIHQTRDNGYILAGYTNSTDGNVIGNHSAYYDMLILKLDSSGNIQWQKCYGGSDNEEAHYIEQTSDGGYIIAGNTWSNDGDVSGIHGSIDAWIVKINETGDIQWQKCLGGSELDNAWAIKQTDDNGFIMAGETWSSDGDVVGFHGGYVDVWIVKLDTNGNIQWKKCFGGSNDDRAWAISKTIDGGYIFTGRTWSVDGDITEYHDDAEMWVVKLNALGNIQWQKCFGGSNIDYGTSIQQTLDQGFIMLGSTKSSDGDISGLHSNYYRDIWVVKINENGDILWQKCLGGTYDDDASNIIQTKDGNFILSGRTNSNDGDISVNHGDWDIWIVKLIAPDNIHTNYLDFVDIYPNPTSEYVYIDLPEFTRKIEIYNSTGILIKHIIPQKEVAEIPVKDLPQGLYLVKLYSAKEVITTKFVKK